MRTRGLQIAGSLVRVEPKASCEPNFSGRTLPLGFLLICLVALPLVGRGQGGPPVILAQPQSQTVPVGSSCTFTVVVSSVTLCTYQWKFNGTNLSGATRSALQLFNVDASSAGTYRALINNSDGPTLSSNAILTVLGSAATVVGWGDNTYGQLTLPAGLSNVVAITAAAYHCLALRNDGTVVAWGNNGSGQANVPPGLNNVVATAGGDSHSLALKSDGTVVAWGSNLYGQTNVPPVLNVIAIGAGANHSLAVRNDGTVVAWGSNNHSQTNVPAAVSNIVAVAGGTYHSLALRNDGKVFAWGYNNYGQGVVPTSLSNVVAIAAGDNFNLALKRDGRVVAWGQNSNGQTNVPSALTGAAWAAGGALHGLGLKSSGTVVPWGNNTYGQTNVPAGSTNVIALEAGALYSLSLRGNGSPAITVQPASQRVNPGDSAIFTVMAAGAGTLSYQWRLDGQVIPGATSNSLTRANVELGDTGTYSVMVSNTLGVATSAGAVLSLPPVAPAITAQPQSLSVNQGEAAVFTVSATGTAPLAYQWQLDGTVIAGASDSTLVVPQAAVTNAGNYSVVVSNAAGWTRSSNALLTVTVPIVITSPSWGSNGFRFELSGPIATFVIQGSTNLINWVPLATNSTAPTGVLAFWDPASTNFVQRFYRALQQ
jgi:hypothetical protein